MCRRPFKKMPIYKKTNFSYSLQHHIGAAYTTQNTILNDRSVYTSYVGT